jgi:hypothetical protein
VRALNSATPAGDTGAEEALASIERMLAEVAS